MDSNELNTILAEHKKWVQDEGGNRAYLRGADLSGAYLNGAYLRGANLRGADLHDANLGGAYLGGADLRGANLGGAYLGGADLRGANLRGAVGNMRELRSMQIETYPVTYTASHMQIGCQRHTLEEWWSFDDEKIKGMDDGALEWWRKWRPLLQQIIETAPAT